VLFPPRSTVPEAYHHRNRLNPHCQCHLALLSADQ
ncbi:hypothetical protein A2U01_0070241, partial [Trifolium medium]|nr:hypothetical protein [Trifolium medium]